MLFILVAVRFTLNFRLHQDLRSLTMIKRTVTVTNSAGLHARPAAQLVQVASRYTCDFFIHMYGYRVNGKSILGVMTLAAEQGAELELEFVGEDEEKACEEVLGLFSAGFNEP